MKRKAIVVLIIIAAITSLAKAQEQVFFTDPHLESAVKAQLELLTPPTTTDMLELLYLDAYEYEIIDLGGLEYAVNLMDLDLGANMVWDLSPISGLTQLKWLFLDENVISDISPLAELTNLELLSLDTNDVNDISPLAGKENLDTLWLFNNNITDISAIAESKYLIELDLGTNRISDISAIAEFEYLDVLYLDVNPLNTSAYCTYLPLIAANNPMITEFLYDPNHNPLTNDCSTDITELAAWTPYWLDTACGESNNWCQGADLNHNGNVNIKDFAEFLELWL